MFIDSFLKYSHYLDMGSEQSHALGDGSSPQRPKSGPQLQRGYTIASSAVIRDSQSVEGPSSTQSSRPVSPPMSICSDSDLPYISYTSKPIGGSVLLLL